MTTQILYYTIFTAKSFGSANISDIQLQMQDKGTDYMMFDAFHTDGVLDPLGSVSADFNYNIYKGTADTNGTIEFIDTSTSIAATIDDWNWFVDGVKVSDSQDFNYSVEELQDLNVCLFVADDFNGFSDSNCQSINSGDWTAPNTTLSTAQVSGTAITTLTFTCNDNNSGCKKTHYNINGEGWLSVANTGSADVNYDGTGANTVLFFSEDDNDNNESQDSGSFTTYGYISITTYNEETESTLTNVNMNFNGTNYTLNPTQDINIQGLTTGEYTLTFSKTAYGTRYYQVDLNQYSVIDKNIMMLSNTDGRNIEFQVYKTDQTTKYSNTYIELYNNAINDWVAGKRKTDSDGYITFFVNPNDANYVMKIFGSDGTIEYTSMVLSVEKPKDETTGTDVDGNWEMKVTGLAWQNYTGITDSQNIFIYANTSDKYGLTIVDENAAYYSRKYYVGFTGGTTAETLQPYLVPIADAVSTTIYTLSGYTQQPVGNIEIQIYKTISGVGRVLVEQVVTDAKGEALVSLVANDEYEFEIYNSENTLLGIQVYAITSTSTTIYISVDDLSISNPTIGQGLVNVSFTPSRSYLTGQDDSIDISISLTDYDLGLTFTSATIWVTNTDVDGNSGNDVNLFEITITDLTKSFDLDTALKTIDGNTYDDNGQLIVYVKVLTSQGYYYTSHVYKAPGDFDWQRAIGYDLRPTMGCSATNDPFVPCPTMLLIALFVSFLNY